MFWPLKVCYCWCCSTLQHPGMCAPHRRPSPHFQGQRVSVLCVSNTASRQPPRARSRSSRSQSGSSEHTGVPELREMLGGVRSRLTVSVCCLEGAGPRSAHSPVQVARQLPAALRALLELPFSVCCLAGAVRESACSPVPVSHQPSATSDPVRAPGAPGLSLDPVSTPEFQSSLRCLVACAPGSRSQSAVLRVQVHSPPAPQCRWPASCPGRALLELAF